MIVKFYCRWNVKFFCRFAIDELSGHCNIAVCVWLPLCRYANYRIYLFSGANAPNDMCDSIFYTNIMEYRDNYIEYNASNYEFIAVVHVEGSKFCEFWTADLTLPTNNYLQIILVHIYSFDRSILNNNNTNIVNNTIISINKLSSYSDNSNIFLFVNNRISFLIFIYLIQIFQVKI